MIEPGDDAEETDANVLAFSRLTEAFLRQVAALSGSPVAASCIAVIDAEGEVCGHIQCNVHFDSLSPFQKASLRRILRDSLEELR